MAPLPAVWVPAVALAHLFGLFWLARSLALIRPGWVRRLLLRHGGGGCTASAAVGEPVLLDSSGHPHRLRTYAGGWLGDPPEARRPPPLAALLGWAGPC
jgi:hypothetical protein